LMVRWKADSLSRLGRKLRITFAVSVLAGAVAAFAMPAFHWSAWLAVTLASWITLSSLQNLYDRVAARQDKVRALVEMPLGFYGMTLAHIGVAVFIVGITLTSVYSQEKDVRLATGQQYNIGGYDFEFRGVQPFTGENYRADEGVFAIYQNGELIAQLHSQKRLYNAGGMPMTEAGIDAGLFRDLYVSLGEPLDETAWSVRLYYKPFIRWIWLGALFMAAGGLLAAMDRRYRMTLKPEQADTVTAGAA
ncbi:MAG: cytochrome c-type biosis protein CcmF, partial [Pseudomonadota bacterium]|nr:cytochrome c-type biosis protein CcmF [Pseudomonadota bacterium]